MRVEELESRYAPATLVNPTLVTFLDADGDRARIRISKPLFEASTINNVFGFDTGTVDGNSTIPQRLQRIDLTSLAAAGASLSVEAIESLTTEGDGFVNVGYIKATGLDLGSVTIRGDLGRVDAGDANSKTTALESVAVHSMGRIARSSQGNDANLTSNIDGKLGTLDVESDLIEATLYVAGKIGAVKIRGSLIGGSGAESGAIVSDGDIASVEIGGEVRGGEGDFSGTIQSFEGAIGRVMIGGSLIAGAGTDSGEISSDRHLGAVEINGDVVGGIIISYDGPIARVTIGGSLIDGYISSDEDLGSVEIGRDLIGIDGPDAICSFGRIARVTIGGSLVGGPGTRSARIDASLDLGPVIIGGDLIGGDGILSATIGSGRDLASIRIVGSVIGGSGPGSARIESEGAMGPVEIQGDLVGGSGSGSGQVTTGRLSRVRLGGTLIGGSGDGSGAIEGFTDVGMVVVQGDVRGGTGFCSGECKRG